MRYIQKRVDSEHAAGIKAVMTELGYHETQVDNVIQAVATMQDYPEIAGNVSARSYSHKQLEKMAAQLQAKFSQQSDSRGC